MRKKQPSLSDAGWPIIVMAVINLILIICVIFVLQNHITPRFGMNVQMASSHFVMGMLDREHSKVLTITAGDDPHFYIGTKAVKNSWNGLNQALSELNKDYFEQMTIIIVADEAVSLGNIQRCVDLILQQGYTCSIAARPPME